MNVYYFAPKVVYGTLDSTLVVSTESIRVMGISVNNIGGIAPNTEYAIKSGDGTETYLSLQYSNRNDPVLIEAYWTADAGLSIEHVSGGTPANLSVTVFYSQGGA